MPDATTRMDKPVRTAPPAGAGAPGPVPAGMAAPVPAPSPRERPTRSGGGVPPAGGGPAPATAAMPAAGPATSQLPPATSGYARPDRGERDRGERERDLGTGPVPRSAGGLSRRARLKVAHINPLSALRLSFVFSLCVFVVLVVAAAVLWGVLDSIGVFNSIVKATDTLTDKSSGGARAWLSFSRVMELALLIGAINVILMTALSTLGALLYNVCSEMIGGVEVTLSEQ